MVGHPATICGGRGDADRVDRRLGHLVRRARRRLPHPRAGAVRGHARADARVAARLRRAVPEGVPGGHAAAAAGARVTKLLDLIERVVPRMRLYPRWAQRLFTVSFAMTLLSFFLWAVIAPAADKAHLIKAVPLEIGVVQGSALGAPVRVERPNDTADRVGDRTESVLEDPISYDLDVQRRTVVAHVPYLELVRRGGPVGGVWLF